MTSRTITTQQADLVRSMENYLLGKWELRGIHAARGEHDAAHDASIAAAWRTPGGFVNGTAPGDRAEFLTGRILSNRFELCDRLEENPAGPLFAALDLFEPGAQAAIQVLRPQWYANTTCMEAVAQRVRRNGSLRHPGVARICGMYADRGQWYVVLEPLAGESLRQVMNALRAPLKLAETLPLINGMGEALSCAHEHHLTHGAFVPENVIVTHALGVKVLNFGFATSETGHEATVGAQVEQDVRSLAGVCYELLAGHSPFGAGGPAATSAPAVPRPAPGLTDKQWQVLAQALGLLPDRPVPDVKTFLAHLNRAAKTPAVTPRVVPPRHRKPEIPATRRSRHLLYGLGTAALLAAALVLIPDARLSTGLDGERTLTLFPAGELDVAAVLRTADQSPETLALAPEPRTAGSAAEPALQPEEASPAAAAPVPEPGATAPAPTRSQVPEPLATESAGTQSQVTEPLATASATSPAALVTQPASPPSGVPGFTADHYLVDEGASLLRVPVERRGSTFGPATVVWWTEAGTALGDTDYADLGRQTEHFADGEALRYLLVPLASDDLPEGPEELTVYLSHGESHAESGEIASARITILDDD